MTKCEFSGCRKVATWSCRKLFGSGGTICVCDDHKPDKSNRPASLRKTPSFYDCKPIAAK